MRTAFVQTLGKLMRKHNDIVAITADMGFSVFEDLQKEFPTRLLNTGVTEQSSISLATGLALSGFKVYFYAQAPFATMRCFEQIRLDIAYNNVNVKIVGVSSGFSSNQLGVSHFALEDVALMRLLPNMTIFTPGDPQEAKWATNQTYSMEGPAYVRLTKSDSPVIHPPYTRFKIGKGVIVNKGDDAAILVSGSLLPVAVTIRNLLLRKNINLTIISMPTVKPLDESLIISLSKKTKYIFSLEEHNIIGGLGSAVAEVLSEKKIKVNFYRFGVPDKFTSVTGSIDYLLGYNGLSVSKIAKKILKLLKK